jgi:hypothetical protein
MGKIFGILLIVLGIWVGLTIFSEGTDSAFGGLFASAKAPADPGSGAPITQRVGQSVSRSLQAHEARTEKDVAE